MNIHKIVKEYDRLFKTIDDVIRTLAIADGHAKTKVKTWNIITDDEIWGLRFNHEDRLVRAILGEWCYEYYENRFVAEIPYDLLESVELQKELKKKMVDAVYQRKIDAENKKKAKIQEKIIKLEAELKDLKGGE